MSHFFDGAPVWFTVPFVLIFLTIAIGIIYAISKGISTFEFHGHSRLELRVSAKDYGLIAEGDQGELTYQGTRFQGFSRSLS